jgi:hypothetical protein
VRTSGETHTKGTTEKHVCLKPGRGEKGVTKLMPSAKRAAERLIFLN